MIRRLIDVAGDLPTQQLSDSQWRNMTLVWAAFFVAIGFLNLYVAFNYSLDFWVKFKVFGLFGLTVIFVFAQVFWIASKMTIDEPTESEEQ